MSARVPTPYDGLKIVDLSHVIAGPFCTHLLADMGADVVKIEPLSGDLMRRLPIRYAEQLSSAFAQYNCGKRSIALNLKSEDARQIVLALAKWADVVVENFAPGTMESLGLSFEELRSANDQVILCSLSTFGAVGPYSTISGFGLLAEAYSGLMAMAGEDDGPPTHFGTPLADMNCGVHAVAAIGAALYARQRTGTGTHVDLSSFDALFAMIDQAVALGNFSGGERTFGKYGTRHPTTVPSGVVPTRGDYVSYGCPGDVYFQRLARAMQQPELAEDPRFSTVDGRVEHREVLYPIIEEWAGGFDSADELVEVLTNEGLAAARIRRVEENLEDPHLIERGTLAPVQFQGVGEVLMQSAPYRFTGMQVGPRGEAPRVGEHSVEVLRDLAGVDERKIDELVSEGVVGVPGREDRS